MADGPSNGEAKQCKIQKGSLYINQIVKQNQQIPYLQYPYVSLASLFGSHGKKRILSNVNNCFSVTRRTEKEQIGVCVDILEHDIYRHFSTREDSGVNVNTNIYEWLCAHLRNWASWRFHRHTILRHLLSNPQIHFDQLELKRSFSPRPFRRPIPISVESHFFIFKKQSSKLSGSLGQGRTWWDWSVLINT